MFPLPLVIHSLLIFTLGACDQSSDENSTTVYTSTLNSRPENSSWFENPYAWRKRKQKQSGVQLLNDAKIPWTEDIRSKKYAIDYAFTIACYVGARKQLDKIDKQYFPAWIRGSYMDKHCKWEAFLSVEPETLDQKKYQDRLRNCESSACGVCFVIDEIYSRVPEQMYPVNSHVEFLDEQKLKEISRKCCRIMGNNIIDATNMFEIILEPDTSSSSEKITEFRAKQWASAKVIQVIDMNKEISDQQIRKCFEDICNDTVSHEIKIHHFRTFTDSPLTLIEYFSNCSRTALEIKKKLEDCNLVDDQHYYTIAVRPLELKNVLPESTTQAEKS